MHEDGDTKGYEAKATEVRVVPLSAVVLEEGSREWAVVMAMRGKGVSTKGLREPWSVKEIAYSNAECDTGWYELPAPWMPHSGEEVRWVRGKHEGTGEYLLPLTGTMAAKRSHSVLVDGSPLYVDTVSKLEV
jgi:hypothetical protein